MRKSLLLAATAAATAMLVLAPAASALAAAKTDVLTTVKVGGPNVKVKDLLAAGLAKGASAVFKTTLGTLTCTVSTFTAKVVTNPAKPGTATESITGQTFSKCKISVANVFITRSSVGNLPYKASVSDAKGNPVKISGQSKAKPLLLSITVKVGATGKPFTCSVKAASISGSYTNKGNATVFVKQKFVYAAGPKAFCPASGTFSAAYGPVRDLSVVHHPAVFVN